MPRLAESLASPDTSALSLSGLAHPQSQRSSALFGAGGLEPGGRGGGLDVSGVSGSSLPYDSLQAANPSPRQSLPVPESSGSRDRAAASPRDEVGAEGYVTSRKRLWLRGR